MKAVKLRGKWFRIGQLAQEGGLGGCEAPFMAGREIDIPVDGDAEEELCTTIHELLHGCFWDLEEDAIQGAADDIAHVLWRMGWRNE